MSGWDINNPLVSISCLTFNHADYIERCIQGFLMQRTVFPYEIFIHDDASTDGTVGIIQLYEAKYPQIIKPIYESKNQSTDKNSSIQMQMYKRMAGKYIAFCEGDDFWIDKNKLQKQFDFLETNEEYFAVGNLTKIISQAKKGTDVFIDSKPGEYSIRDLEEWRLFAHFSSYFTRNFCNYISTCDLQNYLDVKCPGDRKFPFLFLQYGKLYVLPFWGSVYRFQSGKQSFTQSKDYNDRLVLWKESYEVSKYAKSVGIQFDNQKRERKLMAYMLIDYFTRKNRENYEEIRRIRKSTVLKDLNYCKRFFWEACIRHIKKRIWY